jgi:hypothetical protein
VIKRTSCHLRLLVATGLASLAFPAIAAASSWSNLLAAGSHGEAQTQGIPAAPSPVSAACTSATAKTIKVTWGAVAHASSYSVYKSTTSATSGFAVTASGVTASPWTSGTLSNATYWFEVSALIGSNWVSPNSSATGSHVITSAACT